MTALDLSPLFRFSVGFDRMLDVLDGTRAFDAAETHYPPYNIEKLGDDKYRITMAVAGFRSDELNVEAKSNSLVISGRKKEEPKAQFLHRGIATRAFERRFDLAEHIRVADAKLEDGLLHIEMVREVPEALKPRTIKIVTGGEAPALTQAA